MTTAIGISLLIAIKSLPMPIIQPTICTISLTCRFAFITTTFRVLPITNSTITMNIVASQSGSRCHGNGDCQPGLCCARRHGESVCQRKLTLGQRCYVPDGGLEYSLNQLCPCESGLICFQLPASEDSTTEKYNST